MAGPGRGRPVFLVARLTWCWPGARGAVGRPLRRGPLTPYGRPAPQTKSVRTSNGKMGRRRGGAAIWEAGTGTTLLPGIDCRASERPISRAGAWRLTSGATPAGDLKRAGARHRSEPACRAPPTRRRYVRAGPAALRRSNRCAGSRFTECQLPARVVLAANRRVTPERWEQRPGAGNCRAFCGPARGTSALSTSLLTRRAGPHQQPALNCRGTAPRRPRFNRASAAATAREPHRRRSTSAGQEAERSTGDACRGPELTPPALALGGASSAIRKPTAARKSGGVWIPPCSRESIVGPL